MSLAPYVDDLWRVSQCSQGLSKAEEYLKTRGLNLFPDVGYVNLFSFGEKIISSSIVFFIRDCIGEFVGVETRSVFEKAYDTVWVDPDAIPLFGLSRLFYSTGVVLTESVMDAESINQLRMSGLCGLSVRGASMNLAKAYFLGVLLKDKDVYMAFDNDESGVKGAQGYQKFFMDKYGKQVMFLDFPGKDVNSFFLKRGSGFVKDHIVRQISPR